MLGPELVLVLALAVFTAALARTRPVTPSPTPRSRPGLVDPETIRGLALLGAGALGVLAVAVLTVGIVGRTDLAEGLAVIGLFGYAAYLALVVPLSGWLSRR